MKIDTIKGTCKIKSMKHFDQLYDNQPVSLRLPISLDAAAPIIPNPAPTPNKVGGILKRFCRDPGLNRKFLRGLRAFTLRWCRKNLRSFTKSDDLSFETWIDGTDYPQSRKEQLKIIYGEISKNHFRKNSRHHSRCTKVKSFVKDESYPEMKYPRMINSRCDEFKVFSGPIFDAIGKKLGERPEFVKYIPVVERPRYLFERLQGRGRKFFSSDYSSFEAHFGAEMMKNCEFILYNYMTRGLNADMRDRMTIIMSVLAGENDIRFKDISMTLKATRMSGEMNTSVGNGFSNLMINLYMAELHGCGETTICVEGDDGIMTFQYPENAPTEADFKANGLIIKLIESDNLADLSFCGQVFDPDDSIVLTEPFDALVNFGFSRKLYIKAGRALQLQLLRARALSMLYQYNGCPMLTAFACRVAYLTRNITIRRSLLDKVEQYKRSILRDALKLHVDPIFPSATAPCRVLFARLYGVEIGDQIAFENAMADLELDSVIDCSSILKYPVQNQLMFDKYLYQGPKLDLPKIDLNYIDYLDSFGLNLPWCYQMNRYCTRTTRFWL